MTNFNTNIPFQIAINDMITRNEPVKRAAIMELVEEFPKECREYISAWQPLLKYLPEPHITFLDTLISEIKAKDDKPAVDSSKPLVVSEDKPKQFKLEISDEELLMCENPDKTPAKAISNSSLMKLCVTNPQEALENLRRGCYSIEEINYPNSMNWTPLMYVSRFSKTIDCSLDLMKELIQQGALVNQKSSQGNSILYMVSIKLNTTSSPEAFDLLLNHPNILVNTKNNEYMNTSLHGLVGIASNSTVCIHRLLEHPDCDPNLPNNQGSDVLLYGLRILEAGQCEDPSILREKLIYLIKSPKYRLNLKEKLPWLTKFSELDKKNYLGLILGLYQEHNPSGIFL